MADDKVKLTRIGKQLRKARVEKRLTQAEVAKRAGISETHYAQVERGEANPSTTVLLDIAKAVGVTPNDVLL
jgi:transcriptional regulator with XRE-family HTH domain